MKISNIKFQISNLKKLVCSLFTVHSQKLTNCERTSQLAMNQSGQTVIILLFVILIVVTVGLSIVQNSIRDVSTTTRSEQGSRAFSAAEAGLERALLEVLNGFSGDTVTLDSADLGDLSSAVVKINKDLPSGSEGLEYPPISKADFAHVWLADPITTPPTDFYTGDDFNLYFGNCTEDTCEAVDDKPAVEVNVVTRNSSGLYVSNRYFYDSDPDRVDDNGFTYIPNSCSLGGDSIDTTLSSPSDPSRFYCQVSVPPPSCSGSCIPYSDNGIPILTRIRLLYAKTDQSLAVVPTVGSLPPQASIYESTGKSGDTIRKLSIFKVQDVVPFFFDFAIYSIAPIIK